MISGHRLILRYTFGYTNRDTIHSAAESDTNVLALVSALKDWRQHVEECEEDYASDGMLAYFLRYDYRHGLKSQQDLEGRDRLMVSQLHKACQSTNFYVQLGLIEFYIAGKNCGRNPRYWDDVDSGISMKDVIGIDGGVESDHVYIAEDAILQGDPVDCLDPYDKDEDGYDGYGYSTYRYQGQV